MTMKALVVDDEPSVLHTYSLILEHIGYTVSEASSASEAKGLLAEQQFDLLLCDLSLEEARSGFDVIKYARERQPGIPLILMTGYATEEVMVVAQEKGINSIFFKPVDIDELFKTIAQLQGTPQ